MSDRTMYVFSFPRRIRLLICICRSRAFSRLRYARITIDHAAGRSRGTGFARLWNLEDVDKVVAQRELLKLEATGTSAVCYSVLIESF